MQHPESGLATAKQHLPEGFSQPGQPQNWILTWSSESFQRRAVERRCTEKVSREGSSESFRRRAVERRRTEKDGARRP